MSASLGPDLGPNGQDELRHVWQQFRQFPKPERPVRQLRMWHGNVGFADDVLAKPHDVHVKRSRAPPLGGDAPGFAFRFMSSAQKFLGGTLGAQQDHLVEKIPLCHPTNGLGFFNPALSDHRGADKPRQLAAPQGQVVQPVTEIGTQRYERPLKHRRNR